MQSVRNTLLSHLRVRVSVVERFFAEDVRALSNFTRWMSTATDTNHDQIMARVISLVKKFDKVEASKVTETTDFQKDLSLDSLDRVELVMAFEQEFSIEIPDENADKLSCCADVAKYIVSEAEKKKKDSGSS